MVSAGLHPLAVALILRPTSGIIRKRLQMQLLLYQAKTWEPSAHLLSWPNKYCANPRLFCAYALVVVLVGTSLNAFASNSAARKQQARDQFEKAEQMREALNGRPEKERTRLDYQRVADAYRKVYYVAPGSSKADASVVAVAEVLAEMGRQFQPGEKDLNSAIREYEFLRREYPGSKYRFQALFTIGQIYKEDLGDEDAARKTFEEFLAHYPHNSLAPDAKKALAELNQPKPTQKPVEEARSEPSGAATTESVSLPAAPKKPGLPMVTGIRHWSTPDYTRVAIDVDREVKYEAGRVAHPDRIYFDLPDTKLASVLIGKTFEVQDGFLKKIRVAQYQPGYTRVVLEVADISDYSAFLLPNPYRLIIDIHRRQPSQTKMAAVKPPTDLDEVEPPAADAPTSSSSSEASSAKPIAKSPSGAGSKKQTASLSKSESADDVPPKAAAQSASTASSRPQASRPPLRKVIVDESDDVAKPDQPGNTTAPTAKAETRPAGKSAPTTIASTTSRDKPLLSASGDTNGPDLKATHSTSAPTTVAVAPRSKGGKKTGKTAPADVPPTHEAAPTSAGDRSLTRALGLKIGRIVVDAGHGGHDTGTIGPNGLMEKDLVLDVALRLGRMLETRLGADVIFTRDDDTFIPLETRTAIANEHQADLFISIHANSSPDPSARGIETYYLNFTSDPDALEVAARENAVSEKSIFELQDLVKKITLKDKIEESRELATDVQLSLYHGLATRHTTLRDRGVKKAPFVVLIGANMPSILAEISFVSNPTDAARLETPDYREKIANALYQGIAKYAGGLSGVKVASKMPKPTGE
jgi:N-acetylmuramoyl-L-alanine amidase